MMRTIQMAVACVAMLIATAGQVQAEFVFAADDDKFGLGSLTRDTVQGLDFLDLSKTRGRSYTYVSRRFGLGEEFEGFRYATELEVMALNRTNRSRSVTHLTTAGNALFASGSNSLNNLRAKSFSPKPGCPKAQIKPSMATSPSSPMAAKARSTVHGSSAKVLCSQSWPITSSSSDIMATPDLGPFLFADLWWTVTKTLAGIWSPILSAPYWQR